MNRNFWSEREIWRDKQRKWLPCSSYLTLRNNFGKYTKKNLKPKGEISVGIFNVTLNKWIFKLKISKLTKSPIWQITYFISHSFKMSILDFYQTINLSQYQKLFHHNDGDLETESKLFFQMPKSRKRHHSRSRSKSRSNSRDRSREREDKHRKIDSHEKDRDGKKRKLDSNESPNHKRSVRWEILA